MKTMRILAVLLLCVSVASKKRYDGHRLALAHLKTTEDVKLLAAMQEDDAFEELDFWTQPSRVKPTAIRVSPNDFERFDTTLEEAGIDFSVTVDNIQIEIDLEEESMKRSKSTSGEFCDFYSRYCNLAEVNDIIDELRALYPNHIQVDSIGQTVEGNDIRRVRIAENLDDFSKPAIYLEAATHAREWITVSAALHMINKLASGENEESQFMLGQYDWYVIPVHNPDGYQYSHSTDRMWRKNRGFCNNMKHGVDLNRNYDVAFGGAGTSGRCTSDIYRGPSAFSERETVASFNAIANSTNEVFAFFAIHSYGEMLIVPFAYAYDVYPARYEELKAVATEMKNEILITSNGVVNYTVGTAWEILYPAAGGSDDFFYLFGIPYSYTYELSPGTSTPTNGFILNASMIPYVVNDVFVSLWKFADLQLPLSEGPTDPWP